MAERLESLAVAFVSSGKISKCLVLTDQVAQEDMVNCAVENQKKRGYPNPNPSTFCVPMTKARSPPRPDSSLAKASDVATVGHLSQSGKS